MAMNRLYHFFLFISAIILISCTGNKNLGYESEQEQPNQDSDIKSEDAVPEIELRFSEVFKNKEIQINYPSSWEIIQQNAQTSENTKIIVQIMQKSTNETDFRPNINIIFLNNKHSEDTDHLAKLAYDQTSNLGYQTSLIDIRECKISNQNGSIAEYTAQIDSYTLHVFQYIIKKKDNSIVLITATLDHNKVSEQELLAKSIIDSIILH